MAVGIDAHVDGQVCGGYADSMARCAQLLEEHTDVDFVDVNMGCPIDLVCNRCPFQPYPYVPTPESFCQSVM